METNHMLILGYGIPEHFGGAVREVVKHEKADYKDIRTLEGLNKVDEGRYKCLIVYEPPLVEYASVLMKAGSNTVFIWFTTEETIPGIIRRIGWDTDGHHHFQPPANADALKASLQSVFNGKGLYKGYVEKNRLISRLKLIQQLTRSSLHSDNNTHTRKYVMRRLTEYYKARSCSYLEFDAQGELYIDAQYTPADRMRVDLKQRVNKADYEECLNCGEPVINCMRTGETDINFLCAPMLHNGKAVGLLRIRYDTNAIDMAVDRTVLRIAADILASERIRQLGHTALRESRQQATTVLDTTVDAIITIDERGHINTYNQAAKKLFGYSLKEVVGNNVHMLMPSPYKEEHDGYLDNYKKTRKRKIIGIGREVTGRRKDGSTFPMYLAVSEFRVDGKKMYTGIVRDISEERQLEQEVMRISEHERHRIGQDLHDGLGQMLSGIGLLSRRVANKLTDENHALRADMNEIRDLIKEADEYSRGLARGLVKIDLDKGGFLAAIEKLVRQSERLFRISCKISAPQDAEITERTRAEHVYRIVQESINNAVKHGQASEVHITMLMRPDQLRITIQDNGTGFGEDWRAHEGLGVRIMEFRSRLIEAQFRHHNHKSGGAVISCTIPNP